MPSTLTIELYVPYRHCVSSLWDGANLMSAFHSTQLQLSIIVSYYCWASLTPYDRFWWNWFQTPSFRAKIFYSLSNSNFILETLPISPSSALASGFDDQQDSIFKIACLQITMNIFSFLPSSGFIQEFR